MFRVFAVMTAFVFYGCSSGTVDGHATSNPGVEPRASPQSMQDEINAPSIDSAPEHGGQTIDQDDAGPSRLDDATDESPNRTGDSSMPSATDDGGAAGVPTGPSARPDSAAPTDSTAPTEALTARQILIRASIDLRGRRPSREALDGVALSPASLDERIEEYFDDPAFADSVADLFSRAFRNRSDMYRGADDDDGPGAPLSYQQSAADESLMLLRHIVGNNLSYDEFLKADYTFANEDLATVWRMVGYDADVGGWQRVRYGDGRPAAGYLSLSSVFMRYLTDDFNYHRGRANAMSRILLCSDFLKIPVLFPRDLDLSDQNAIENAISTNPACIGCHDVLDPMASFFTVYGEPELELGEVRAQYRPENANEWMDTTGQAPAFYGRPGTDLADLARFIREDPRYARCAVTRVYEGLLDRPINAADSEAIDGHLRVFEEGGRTFKALYRSIIADPVYRGVAEGGRSATSGKMLSPATLQSMVTHVTGFFPKIGGVDLLRAGGEGENAVEVGGLRILAGGLSAFSGDYPARTANVTRVLVQARLADAAALYVVQHGGPKTEALVPDTEVDPGEAGIERLFNTVLGRAPSDQDVEVFNALFQTILGQGGNREVAYAALISVLLRDPEFIIY